jgi:hypothetical protein
MNETRGARQDAGIRGIDIPDTTQSLSREKREWPLSSETSTAPLVNDLLVWVQQLKRPDGRVHTRGDPMPSSSVRKDAGTEARTGELGRVPRQRGAQPRAKETRGGQPRTARPRAKEPRAGQARAGQPRAGQPRAGQARAGQPPAGQERAGPSRAKEARAGQPATAGRGGGLSLPSLSVPRIRLPAGRAGTVLWWGGLATVAALGVVDWPVAALIAAGTWVAEQHARESTRAGEAG